MSTLQDILLFLHLLGMAAIVGGFAATLREKGPNPAMVWGARFQLLTGFGLMGLAQSQHWHLNNAWLGVKMLVAIIVCGLLEVASGRRGQGKDSTPLVHAAGALAIVNVAVAVFWH